MISLEQIIYSQSEPESKEVGWLHKINDALVLSFYDNGEWKCISSDITEELINTETTNRTQADTALYIRIGAEANTRNSADIALSSALNIESSYRANADTQLNSNIVVEKTRATTVENIIGTSIGLDSETKIYTNTGQYIGKLVVNTVTSDIKALDTQITNLQTSVIEPKPEVKGQTDKIDVVSSKGTDGHIIYTVQLDTDFLAIVNNKVDKVTGSSLLSNAEIQRLSTMQIVQTLDGTSITNVVSQNALKQFKDGIPAQTNDIIDGQLNTGGTIDTAIYNKAALFNTGLLGSLTVTSADPTPGKNGYYVYTDSGTNTHGTIDAGDTLLVTYDSSVYTYTLIKKVVDASVQDVYKKSNYNDGNDIIDFNTIHLITNNPEFICVAIDTDDKILYGIKANGQPYFGVGCPQQVKDYVNEKIYDIDNIYKRSNPNDEDGNVVDTNTIVSIEKNPEFVSLETDSDGKIIESTDTKGNKTVYGNLNVKGDIYSSTSKQINDIVDNFEEEENPEYVKILIDADNKIIDSIDNQGVITHNSKHVFNNGIKDTTGKINEDAFNYVIDKSSDLAKVLREKGDMVSSTDWSDKESTEIPETRCAYINITSSDGSATTWPTTKTANKKYWMQFWDMQGNYFKKRIILNAQGSSSMDFIKKNGEIDICNDEWIGDNTFKIKFGNWLAFDSFHLKAYYTDFFKGVSVMAYKLADEVELSRDALTNRPWKRQLLTNYTFGTDQTNSAQVNDLSLQLDNEAKCHPDAFPCIVYLDNEFYGIYAFSIKKHRDNYHMDKGTAEHIHLDGMLSPTTLWGGTINWSQFEIRNPKNLYYKKPHNGSYEYNADVAQAEIAGDDEVNTWITAGKLPDGTEVSSKIKNRLQTTAKVKNYIIRLSNALAAIKAETDVAKQKTLFESYFDAISLIDYEIVQLATGDNDGFYKNWQWITLDGSHWSACEYDKDMSFGGYFTGAFTQAAPSTGGWVGNDFSTPMGLAVSLYRNDIVSMWKELTTANILTTDNIISIANDWIKRIGTDNFKKEYIKWNEAPCCRADLVDTEHWKRSNEWKSGIGNNTYDNTKTYSIGETCYYGFGYAYKFTAITGTTGNPPLTGHYNNYPSELGYYDSFWRLANYIKQRISVENTFINSL